MKMAKLRVLLAFPLVTAALTAGTAASAAALSENASCVAQAVHAPVELGGGPPGQGQREAHIPRFGTIVSSVAHRPSDACCVCPETSSTDDTAVEP